jgi:4-alpha-glucanotransferase
MKKYDLPGMLVLLFAFDESMPRNPYILHNHEPRNIVYTGTHDNNTVRGWFDDEGSPQDKERVSRYMNMPFTRDNAATVLTRMALMSVAERAVIPLQDYLNIGGEGRINKPSTLEGNWQWMAEEKALTEDLASSLHSLMKTYGRL